MSSLDDVWSEIKIKAAEYARDGVIPTYRHAKGVITSLLHDAHLDPRPTSDAIDFYTRELIALTQDESDKNPV